MGSLPWRRRKARAIFCRRPTALALPQKGPEIEVSGAGSDDDTSPAGYAHGGVDFAISETFHLGLHLRLLFGSDMEIVGVDTDADYGQLALVLGFAF